MNKTKMQYRVCTARNPISGEPLLRPMITNRNTMSMRQLVAYAKTAGYVRGQQRDLEGLLGGFIEAMQDRGKAGYAINMNDWFVISGRLKGTVGEDGALTSENEYHVTITASKDLKVGIDNFSWTRADDNGVVVKVDGITSPNGKPNEVTKSQAIVVNGKNLAFDGERGDAVTVTYEGAESPVALMPSEQSGTYLRFEWPSTLDGVETGTKLTFVFKLHVGEGAAVQTVAKTATVVGAE